MAGLVPAIPLRDAPPTTRSPRTITPRRICLRNKPRLPRARPVLHIFLALNRISRCRKDFKIDEPMNVEPLRVSCHEAVSMFIHAPDQIARNANVDRGHPAGLRECTDRNAARNELA